MAMVMRDSRAAWLAALVVFVTIAVRAHAVQTRATNVTVVEASGVAVPDLSKQDVPAR
jgi:hypothetical protein